MTTLVRFVGGPLDGATRALPDTWHPGQSYRVDVQASAPSHTDGEHGRVTVGFREVEYELRADHYGPAQLVGVLRP